MASVFKFELVSPEKVILAGEAEQVMLPGSEGDMTILPGHAPVISSLRPGVIDVEIGGTRTRLYVSRAFAEVGPERVTVLAERVHDVADLDAAKVEAELEIARQEHAEAKDDAVRHMAGEAITALTKLKTAHW